MAIRVPRWFEGMLGARTREKRRPRVPRLSSRTPRCLAATFLVARELSHDSLTVKSFRGARRSARGGA